MMLIKVYATQQEQWVDDEVGNALVCCGGAQVLDRREDDPNQPKSTIKEPGDVKRKRKLAGEDPSGE